jgi:hypothetical protein
MKRYMKVGGAAVLALSALLLSGCGGTASPQPTVTVTQQPTMSAEDGFLADLYSTDDIYISNMSDSELIMLGRQVCNVLDSGVTVKQMALSFIASGEFTNDQYPTIGRIIGASVYNLCPDYSYQIDQLTETY